MPEPTPDNWVTVSEAVGLLGKSERTIRRYIATGRLSSRKEKGRLRVNVPDVSHGKHTEPADPAALQAQVDAQQALIKHLTGEVDSLRGALATALQKRLEAPRRRRWRWPWSREK